MIERKHTLLVEVKEGRLSRFIKLKAGHNVAAG